MEHCCDQSAVVVMTGHGDSKCSWDFCLSSHLNGFSSGCTDNVLVIVLRSTCYQTCSCGVIVPPIAVFKFFLSISLVAFIFSFNSILSLSFCVDARQLHPSLHTLNGWPDRVS